MRARLALLALGTLFASACRTVGTAAPGREAGATSCSARRHSGSLDVPAAQLEGTASYYGAHFQGRPTASGEPFDARAFTAAHRTLRFGTLVRVTNLANGRSVNVCINDRGPYAGDRILDLSEAAARVLGLVEAGTATVHITIIE